VRAGPLPKNVNQLEFQAAQTYSDGEVVNWNEPTVKGGDEPEHPAPVPKLTKAKSSGH
jgi:periplasmic copper chaperone A